MFDVNEFMPLYEEENENKLEISEIAQSDEVLISCFNTLGRVDLEAMSRSSGKTVKQLVLDLRGKAIFQDPFEFENDENWCIEKGWQFAASYLSGDIRNKLIIAEEMNRRFAGCFDCNVKALKKLLSDPIHSNEIHIHLGAPWIPSAMVAEFAKELLKTRVRPTVIFIKEIGRWRVTPPDEAINSVANNMTYGTVDISALQIIEHILNAKPVKVLRQGANGSDYVLDKDATLAASEKEKEIIRLFEKWARADEKRIVRLEECYNEAFCGYCVGSYDGSFLTFPDLNPDIEFYKRQKDAVARWLLSEGNLLFAHNVGAGKTYIMCAGAHESYRMGISRKNLFVVLNNVLKATVETHRLLYPNDKILAVFPKDFTPSKRAAVLEDIRDNDYVAIFMAYSSFDMLVMSKDYWTRKMQDEIDELRRAAALSIYREEKKMLSKKKKALSKKLSEHIVNATDKPWLSFDKLGIETLIVDEAHNYKNIPLNTKIDNIVGMHSKGSAKCKEMLEKTKVVKKLIMATGTPLTNSLADLYVLQIYLQPEQLKFRDIETFDMWINTFGERETNFEIDVDSRHLKAVTRFSTFHNLTELMSLFSTVCDFSDVDTSGNELPKFSGYIDVCTPKNKAQAEYIRELSERCELIRSHRVKRTEDNLLKITTDGRKCALDIRLVDKAAYLLGSEEHKADACAKKVFGIYENFPETCQVIFSDIGTPKASFNIYDYLKFRLVEMGIPETEIAFVHDATTESARSRLFTAMNKGQVRVVIGSTLKLGVGVNVQERLIALHHLSVPWRPADMVQREGRIIRQGNRCEEVFIYRYITEGSFDSYSWQLLENKQRFISSFLSCASGERSADDVADVVLSYAEVKALAIGNPLIKKRVETSNLLERTKISCRQRQKQLLDLRKLIEETPRIINELSFYKTVASMDMSRYTRVKEVIPNEERMAFGEELIDAIKQNHLSERERFFDSYQGFDIYLPANMDREKPHIYVRSINGGFYRLEMETDKALGCTMKIDRLLERLPKRIESYENQIKRAEKERDDAVCDMEKGNLYEKEVERLEKELDRIDKQLCEDDKKSA